MRISNPESLAERMLDKPVDEIASNHLKCVTSLQEGDVVSAFHHQYNLLQSAIKVFQNPKTTNWFMKVIHTICLELRLLAGPADKAADNKKHPVECMEKAAEGLMACFRICAADK